MPVLIILNLDLQFGSGQATSASVVIQSLGEVILCFAASRGRTEPEPVVQSNQSRVTI